MDDDPAEKMRVARALAARALGVDELPPDADVEMCVDAEGNVHVRGSVMVEGVVPTLDVPVKLV